MSDAIDRDAALNARCVPRPFEPFEDWVCPDCGMRNVESAGLCAARIRSLPAVPPSPAERLARAVVAETNARVAVLRDRTPEAIDAANRAAMECIAAEAAYRAAKPDSTGAPPAAVPAKEPAPCGTCFPDRRGWISGVGGWNRCPECRPGGAA